MICPDCHTENIPGADFCESCGQDLHILDLPSAQDAFTEHLLHDTLGELCPERPAVVSPDDPVFLAIHIMHENECDSVLVMQGGQLVGILTERDILMKAAGDDVDLNAIAVRQIMTPDPVVLREEDTLAVALHKMSVGEFRHIPLVTAKGPSGTISIQDLFSHVCEFIDEQAEAVS